MFHSPESLGNSVVARRKRCRPSSKANWSCSSASADDIKASKRSSSACTKLSCCSISAGRSGRNPGLNLVAHLGHSVSSKCLMCWSSSARYSNCFLRLEISPPRTSRFARRVCAAAWLKSICFSPGLGIDCKHSTKYCLAASSCSIAIPHSGISDCLTSSVKRDIARFRSIKRESIVSFDNPWRSVISNRAVLSSTKCDSLVWRSFSFTAMACSSSCTARSISSGVSLPLNNCFSSNNALDFWYRVCSVCAKRRSVTDRSWEYPC